MESSSEWTIVDLTPATEPEPEPEPSVKVAMLNALSDIARRRLGVDLTGEFTVDTDPDNGDLTITMAGLTLNETRTDVVPSEREYEWTGYIYIRVDVSGKVTARDEDEAQELAVEALSGCDLTIDAYGDVDVDDWNTDDSDVYEVSEV